MKLHVYKYQGAGNDFVIIDNRQGKFTLTPEQVHWLCDRRFGIGADGLMTLCASDSADFEMHYYNADGPEGTMCGNGGRCLVAFAARMGITHFDFQACDGPHRAALLEQHGDCSIVRLKMRDVEPPVRYPDGWHLETGSTHFVQWVKDLASFPVDVEGKRLRWDARFPRGANVNFVEPFADHLAIRTYERGVEARPPRRWLLTCMVKNVSPEALKMAGNVLNLPFVPRAETWRSISSRKRTVLSTMCG